MANVDAPSGLAPIGHLLGLNWSARCQMYCIPSTDDTNQFAIGDPVVLAGSADANGVPTITLATAGTNPVLGCIVSGAGATLYGGTPGVPAETPILIPATKTRDYYVLVADDPWIIFAIQEDSDGGNIAAASIGLNANLIASAASNGYVSGWELDSSSVTSGSTAQVKILRARQIQGNTLGSANCVFEVLINNHPFKAGVTGL